MKKTVNNNTTPEERGYDFSKFDLFDDVPFWFWIPIAFFAGFAIGCMVHHL